MNALELSVYNLVKRNPRLKIGIRNIYQRICDLVPTRTWQSPYEINAREGYYFGFHDKSPWSPDNTKLLANRILVPLGMPRPQDTLEVGFFEGRNYSDFIPISTTKAWNWQMGCMLQWVGSTEQIIFNEFEDLQHVAKIYDINARLVKTLPCPVGAVSPDGQWGLNYSFERCNIYSPGYGYANGVDPELSSEKPITHGIQLVNLNSGAVVRLFSVHDIASLDPDPTMDDGFHYLSHCQFSTSGERFVFFHRAIKNFNVLRTRMLSCDLTGKDLFVFPTTGMVSHVAWRDDCHVLAYSRIKDKGDRYVLFEDKTGSYEIIGEESFNSDGHPSFSPNRRWIITDTYPDRFRMTYLSLYDAQKHKRIDLAKLKSPRKFASATFLNNWQADLHPRWDRTGRQICFDSAYTGKRALCTIDLGSLAGEGGQAATSYDR